MRIQIKCGTEGRRLDVKGHATINGIDYLEVLMLDPPASFVYRPLLLVYCFKDITGLDEKNVKIERGVRIKNIKAERAQCAEPVPNFLRQYEIDEINKIDAPTRKRVLVILPNADGDFSTYTLRLIRSADNPELPPIDFDVLLSQIDFSFKVECQVEFDCKPKQECPPEVLQEPVIDYMAKDYASFRRLMLDRLAMINPDWKERNPADLGIALVELLAYVGDQLSYYQDAVATEAYLGTARSRISVRRYARLLDYSMHDGCNARAWVCMEVNSDGNRKTIPKKTKLLTGNANEGIVVNEDDFENTVTEGVKVFETMDDIKLYEAHNEIQFYTWGDSKCCLPRGATRATLKNKFKAYSFTWGNVLGDDSDKLIEFLKESFDVGWVEKEDIKKSSDGKTITISNDAKSISIKLDEQKAIITIVENDKARSYEFFVKKENDNLIVKALSLKVGDVLIFEETRSPTTGKCADADPLHRHAVRLTEVIPKEDELYDFPVPVVDIAWDAEDAFPFPLCLYEVTDPEDKKQKPVSVAHGNVILADHGYTIPKESLEGTSWGRKFRPRLSRKPLTYKGSFDQSSPAASAFNYDVRKALPEISVDGEDEESPWKPVSDLLSSDRFATEFVVEMENDGTAQIRFGDDKHDMNPQSNAGKNPSLSAVYRIGNGREGNVGAEAITRIVGTENFAKGITKIRNPMPAQGGRDPEKLDEVRQNTPEAFRTQERAVTESDYAEVLKRHPEVQRAAAMIRWTGSWYTVFVAIDRYGGRDVDEDFKTEIHNFLNSYRLAGYDVEINAPLYVPLEIQISVCVDQNHFREEVKEALLEVFSNRVLPDGRRGFFHPDNFTFGQSVFLSKIYEATMNVDGVSSVVVNKFTRRGGSDKKEEGVIKIGSYEIAQLDNDPNYPDKGTIEFVVEGGR